MLCSGVTMFADPGTAHQPDVIANAVEGLGMRASLAAPWLMDGPGASFGDIGEAAFDRGRSIDLLGSQLWRNKDANALVRGHVSLYGLASQSDELALAGKAVADENGVMFNMHQSQAADDARYDDQRFGRHPLVHYADIGLLGESCVFVHMNVLRDDEIEPVVNSGMSIVWSPMNTWFYGTRQRFRNRIPELFHRGVNVSIGADLCKAIGFGDQLYTAYVMARDQGDFLSIEDVLQIQTINGAKALGLADRLGSLEPGKRADIVVRNNDLPDAWPRINMERVQLLLSRSKSVDTVIVDGRIVVKDGRHTLMDQNVVYDLAQKAAERIVERGAG